MQIPPPFTPLSIAGDKDLIHTPSIHSSLALSVYCLPLYTKVDLTQPSFAVAVKAGAGGLKAAGAAGLSGGAGWRMTEIKVEMERQSAENERVQ